jgi:DNA-binding transcriptional regulator YiaG
MTSPATGWHSVCHREGNLLTSEEFKAGRKALGLSVYELGHILNTTPDTVRKWEMPDHRNTARGPNPVAQRVLQWMLDGYRPPEWPSDTDSSERATDDSD